MCLVEGSYFLSRDYSVVYEHNHQFKGTVLQIHGIHEGNRKSDLVNTNFSTQQNKLQSTSFSNCGLISVFLEFNRGRSVGEE
jgi:hypothetical protein